MLISPKALCKENDNILQNFSLKLKLPLEICFSLRVFLVFHNTQTELHVMLLYTVYQVELGRG